MKLMDGSNKRRGFLLALLFVFALILLGELFYYFKVLKKNNKSLISTVLKTKAKQEGNNPLSNLDRNREVINNYINNAAASFDSLYIIDKIKGRITKIDTQKQIKKYKTADSSKYPGASNWVFSIYLNVKGDTIHYIIGADQMKKTKFFMKKNGEIKPINASEFRQGDLIVIQEKIDMLSDNCSRIEQCIAEQTLTRVIN